MTTRTAPHRLAGRFEAAYPYLLLTVTMLCWAGNWVIGRAARDVIPPAELTFFRWILAAVCLAPFAIPRLKGKTAVIRRNALLIAILSIFGAAFFQVAVYTGLHYTSAINAVLMNSVTPLMIIGVAWLLDGERVTPRQLIGMLLSFIGIFIIIFRGDPETLLRLRINTGDLIIFFTLPAWALYCVLLRRVSKELDTLTLLFLISLCCIAVLAPAFWIEQQFIEPARFSLPGLAIVLYTGIVASFLAYLCWNRGIELIGPNRAGFTTHLLPAFATVLAVGLLGETLHAYHLVGIAVILLGVWLASSARKKKVADPLD
jgi:drug/metabolite transporter (DMT)-like permease